jgi:hypothetical protein
MSKLVKSLLMVGVLATLTSCELISQNNDRAQAACVEQRGFWNKEIQQCSYRDSTGPFGLNPKNNETAEAVCIAQGKHWNRKFQQCSIWPSFSQ